MSVEERNVINIASHTAACRACMQGPENEDSGCMSCKKLSLDAGGKPALC